MSSAAKSVCRPERISAASSISSDASWLQVAAKHLQGVLSRWPKDTLRPDCQLQDVLARRLDKTTGAAQGNVDLKQTNALYSLLEDRYKNKVNLFSRLNILIWRTDTLQYRAPTKIFEPQSNPTYYNELIKELEEAPNRSFLQRIAKRLSGMIRLT